MQSSPLVEPRGQRPLLRHRSRRQHRRQSWELIRPRVVVARFGRRPVRRLVGGIRPFGCSGFQSFAVGVGTRRGVQFGVHGRRVFNRSVRRNRPSIETLTRSPSERPETSTRSTSESNSSTAVRIASSVSFVLSLERICSRSVSSSSAVRFALVRENRLEVGLECPIVSSTSSLSLVAIESESSSIVESMGSRPEPSVAAASVVGGRYPCRPYHRRPYRCLPHPWCRNYCRQCRRL